MQRISITGDAASGKTELAYYLCANYSYSFFSIGQLYLDLLEFCKDDIIIKDKLIPDFANIVNNQISNNKFELGFKLENINSSISIQKLKLLKSNKSVSGEKVSRNLSILNHWVNNDMITNRINSLILKFLESDNSKLIIDGRRGYLFSTKNIFLTATFEIRANRLMKNKNLTLNESYYLLDETDKRDREMNSKAKNSFNTNVIDTTEFDLKDLFHFIENMLNIKPSC